MNLPGIWGGGQCGLHMGCGGTQSWLGSSSRRVICSLNLIKMQTLLYSELVGKGNGRRGSVSYQAAHTSDILFQQAFAHGWCSISASLSKDGGLTSRHCKGPSCLDWTWWCEISSRRETCKELNLGPNLMDPEAEGVPDYARKESPPARLRNPDNSHGDACLETTIPQTAHVFLNWGSRRYQVWDLFLMTLFLSHTILD